VGKPDGDPLVMLEPLVICSDGAVHESQHEALHSGHGVIHDYPLDGSLPLQLAGGQLVGIGKLARQGRNAEYEIQLGEPMIALDLLRVGHELFVDSEKGGPMQNGEQWRPFLEVDVDALIRE
jgi:hypothetical protein